MGNTKSRQLLWDKRKTEGKCVYCGVNPPKVQTNGCDECLEKKVQEQVLYSQKHKERTALYRKRIKKQAFEKYGGKCACCGETEPMFLTIDHINEDGGKERKSMSNGRNTISSTQMYMKLIRTEKRDDLQVLCFNCNLGRNMNGGICPHHKPSPETFERNEDLRSGRGMNIGCKADWPTDNDLIVEVNESSYSAVGRRLGVHMTAVKNRLKRRNLLHLITKNNRDEIQITQ